MVIRYGSVPMKMGMKAEEVKGWNVFKQIFADHWEGFKRKYPKYSEGHYEEQVKRC